MRAPHLASLMAMGVLSLVGCAPDRTMQDATTDRSMPRDTGPDPRLWLNCQLNEKRCYRGTIHQTCVEDGEFRRVVEDDCVARGLVCDPDLGCLACAPNVRSCSPDESSVVQCRADGSGTDFVQMCDASRGEACRNGSCQVLCESDTVRNTNIGCEYYTADLDNAVVGAGESAASQQYAVVISNPDRFLTARVRIEWNTAPQGQAPRIAMIDSALIGPQDLEVFPLPAREVDCSMPGTFNTGTGTCLSSNAYRVTSTIPVIAYQFNPLENANVFSNDASLLVPTNSLDGDYVVMGWPQTIADTDNPDTDFNSNLRSFLTVVGTAANTRVTITPSTDIIPGGPLPMGARAGQPFEVSLGQFDVLNLETGSFLADFTGTRVQPSGGAVAVFSGSEAADVPTWTQRLTERKCCADHLEEQLFPRRTSSTTYVAARVPPRSPAVKAAGGPVDIIDEPQWFRILATDLGGARVSTTLTDPQPDAAVTPSAFTLAQGQAVTLRAYHDFVIQSDARIAVATFTGSQGNTGIPNSYPGGDPSFIMLPPLRQWRSRYVFLTPDKYAFDFVTVVAKPDARVTLDGTPLPYSDCTVGRDDACTGGNCPAPAHVIYRCQLSFPVIDQSLPPRQNVLPGRQTDGVHIVETDDTTEGAMVLVTGFDSFVGYGYPAGTRLQTVD